MNGEFPNKPQLHLVLLESERTLGTEYAEVLAPDIVAFYQDCGLDPSFVAIFSKHLTDMHVTAGRGVSGLDVTCESQDDMRERPTWIRRAQIDKTELLSRKARLARVLSSYGMTEDHVKSIDNDIADLALDWIFFELTADMVGNSVYMQQRFDSYYPDFNGQAATYQCELNVSRQFLESYSDVDQRAVLVDTALLRAGIGLRLLQDGLLRRGIISNAKTVEWVIEDLRRNATTQYPELGEVEAYDINDIILRLSSVRPRNVRQDWLNLQLIEYDEE